MHRPHVLLIALGFLLLAACDSGPESVTPEVRSITESVYASATVRPVDAYEAFAAAPGIVQEVLVDEGDVVGRDDVLLRIENTSTELNVEQARLALDLARERAEGDAGPLAELERTVDLAREKAEQDSIDFARRAALWAQDIGSRQQYDQARLQAERSRSDYQNARSRLELTRLELQTELDRARTSYAISTDQAGDYTVRARRDARVYGLYKEVGERVGLQEPLALLGDTGRFLLELEVDERDITGVRVDQRVLVTMDSHPDEVFEARVAKIYPLMDPRTRTFRVDAVFERAPSVLYPNLSAEANIVLQQKDSALVIPRSHLTEDQCVMTPDGGCVPVETGLTGLDQVEVVSGIDRDTRIIRPE